MLFTPLNAAKVIAGLKTQTRRIVKDNEFACFVNGSNLVEVETIDDVGKVRVKWVVGKTYAIQPGRGKPTIGHLRLKQIRRESLQAISIKEIWLEGFGNKERKTTNEKDWYSGLWDSTNKTKGTRWEDNPDVWVLTFEVTK
jgi:hypothetical protein